jgi:phage portal protein BeeE
LDIAGARLTASCVMARYVSTMTTSPPPFMTLTTDQQLNEAAAQSIADQWATARAANAGLPVVLESGLKLETLQVNARDMALLELAQFTDARICVLLGVPPFLMALPSGDSMTYSNVEQVFEYHDRSQLRTEAVAVMTALSGWALPRGQNVELDREEYSRPPLTERVNAYKTLVELGAMTADEIRPIERTFFAAAPAVDSPLVAVNGDPNA